MPISPQQLQSVLGSEQVQAIAAKVGLSPDQVKNGLAQILPQLVDHLTPNGQVPQGDLMSKRAGVVEDQDSGVVRQLL